MLGDIPVRPHKVEGGKALVRLMREYRDKHGSGANRHQLLLWVEMIEDVTRLLQDGEVPVSCETILEFVIEGEK